MTIVSLHKGTIMLKMCEITNVLLFAFKIFYYFASSVQLMTWILLHVLAFHPFGAIAREFVMDIIVTYGTFSISFILVTTDVVGDNWCAHFGLWPFRSVAVSVCGRPSLWPFRFVAVSVCGRSGLWPSRCVAVSVCGRFGCGRFGLWPLWPVTVRNYQNNTVELIYREISPAILNNELW